MIRRNDLKLRLVIILGLIGLSIFYVFPFKEKINLGLDLKGGMYLILKVDTSKVAKEKVAQAREVALEVIRNRIDEFGVKEPIIQLQGEDSLLIQLPGEVDRERALKLIGQTAYLEFKLVEDDSNKLKEVKEGKVPQGYEVKSLKGEKLLLRKKAVITGSDLDSAVSSFGRDMFPEVKLTLNKGGRKKFAKLTRENVGRRLAIILDGVVKSAPVIREPILDGEAVISGNFTVEEAQDLALVLRAGALPCPLKLEEERTVGPLLGSDSIRRGINSILLGAILVVLFIVVYYSRGGIITTLCLALNLLFIMAGLSFLNATLTLPGVAGMILTLGMAVDANVLIFERVREELIAKKPLSLAIKNGFNRAKTTIFDANITTLIAALFLFIYGTGPIRGFATTLSLGIVASIFTALFIGRTVFHILLDRGWFKEFKMLRFFSATNINFVSKIRLCLNLSILLIGIGMISFISRGERVYGVDFRGGQVLEYKLSPSPNINKVRKILRDKGIKNVVIQEFKDIKGGVIIKSKNDITRKVEKVLGDNFSQVDRLKVTTVGPAVGTILRKKALWAISFSLLGILIYITLRFKHFDFALAGVIALFHDVLVSLGFLSLLGFEVDLLTITALLTIAGYSINDTIVVYDRIREIGPRLFKFSLREIINRAINQTLPRTIITSFTTILVVVSMYLLGGKALRGFSFTLLVGFIAGTYSSIYIASPLVLLFRKSQPSLK